MQIVNFFMRATLVLQGLLVFACSMAFAQYQSANWCVGDSALINWTNNTAPTIQNSASLTPSYADAAMSDRLGNLLFYFRSKYTNANTYAIMGNNHQIIENGDSIHSIWGDHGLVLPFPMDKNKYVLFTFYGKFIPNSDTCLYYHIIERDSANHFKVIDKNHKLLCAKLALKYNAVKHANGVDWWFILHGHENNKIYKFLLTSNGINLHDIQNLGVVHTGNLGATGGCNFCISGEKFVSVTTAGGVNIFGFNRCNGELTLTSDLSVNPLYSSWSQAGGFPKGCVFSKSYSKLYIGYIDTLVQYDLTQALIPKTYLWHDTANVPNTLQITQLKYSFYDDKIYVCHPYTYVGAISTPDFSLGTLNFPDSPGLGCGFNFTGLYLNGRRGPSGLGYTINYNLKALGAAYAYRQNGATAPAPVCAGDSVQLGETFKENGITYQWQPAAELSCTTCHNPKAAPAQTTTYTLFVTNINGCGLTADTATVTVVVLPLPSVSANAGTNQTICAGESVALGAAPDTTLNYLWSTGDTTAQISVSPNQTQTYTLTVSKSAACGLITASATVTVTVNLPNQLIANAGKDTAICQGASLVLGEASISGQTYLWNTGETTAQIFVQPNQTTLYKLTVSGGSCTLSAVDSVLVSISPPVQLVADAGKDTSLCGGSDVVLGIAAVSGQNYLWQPNGETTAQITASPLQTTTYSLTISKQGCFLPATDSVTVTILPKNQPPCVTEIIEPLLPSSNFTIYPNPAQNNFTITHSESAKIEIVNLIGQTVYKTELKNADETQISTESWPNGAYMCNFTTENGRFTSKIVVHR